MNVLRQGKAPKARYRDIAGKRSSFELDHADEVAKGRKVYDVDKLENRHFGEELPMIIGHCDPHKYLYHYTSADTAITGILKFRTLRLNPYTKTNDPKESKDWLFDIGSNEGRDLSAYNRSELSAKLSHELKNKTHVTCFSTDEDSLTGNQALDINKRGFCKPTMWEHYGRRHTGVCLVFNRERLIEQVKTQIAERYPVYCGPVSYADHVIGHHPDHQEFTVNVDVLERVGVDEYMRMHLAEFHQNLFFEKMTDWKAECEWRLLAFTDSDKPVDINFEKSLAGLVFGCDVTPENRKEIFELNHCSGVQHVGLQWKNNRMWYDWN